MEVIITIIVAISAFIATNLDDIFILMSFFVLDDHNKIKIILGQYLGFILLLMVCLLSYNFKFLIPTHYIAILGLFPIIIGLKYFWNFKNDIKNIALLDRKFGQISIEKPVNNEESVKNYSGLKKIFQIAIVTVANGGDNIAVYIPLFLTMDIMQLGLTTITFLIMLGFWCVLGYKMVSNTFFGEKIRVYGHIIFPSILIIIGIGIILRNLPIFLS